MFYESAVASVQAFMLQLLCGLERKYESRRSDEGHHATVTDVQLQLTDLDFHLQPAATRLFLKVGSLCG